MDNQRQTLDKSEIRLGDVVRLRNGDTLTVAGKIDSYDDRDGSHPGPFIRAKGASFDVYLISDLVEVVEENERRCRFCGEGVTASNPETDFCEMCFYSGRAFDEERHALGDRLAKIKGVKYAGVWHTGGGCFVYAVEFDDGRLVTLTDGEGPGLPEVGQPWGMICVSKNEEAWAEWIEEDVEVREGSWTDSDVVREVEKLASVR